MVGVGLLGRAVFHQQRRGRGILKTVVHLYKRQIIHLLLIKNLTTTKVIYMYLLGRPLRLLVQLGIVQIGGSPGRQVVLGVRGEWAQAVLLLLVQHLAVI